MEDLNFKENARMRLPIVTRAYTHANHLLPSKLQRDRSDEIRIKKEREKERVTNSKSVSSPTHILSNGRCAPG